MAIRFVYGLGHTLYRTSANTMLQEAVPSQLRGRILSVAATLRDGALLLSSALAGLLADSLGPDRIFIGLGVLLLAIGLVGGRLLKRTTHRRSQVAV